MELKVITSITDLKSHRISWGSILEEKENTNPFIEWDWINCWWKHYGHKYELCVLEMKRNGKTIGYFPLVKEKKKFFSLYTFMGKGKANYMDIISSTSDYEAVFDEGIKWLSNQKEKMIIDIYGIYAGPLEQQKITDLIQKAGMYFFHEDTPSPAIEFSGIETDLFLKKRSKKHGMDRKERKLKKQGRLYVKKINAKEIEPIFLLHKKRWMGRRDTSGFSLPENRDFFRELAQINSNTVNTDIDGLYFEDKLIAFYYGFQTRGRYLFYIPSHDDDFAIFSPGRLLLKEKVLDCMNQEFETFDLSIGYESYKSDWANRTFYVHNYLIGKGNGFSKLKFWALKTNRLLKSKMKKNKKIVQVIRNREYRINPFSLLKRCLEVKFIYVYEWENSRNNGIVPERKTLKDIDLICQITGKQKTEIISRFYRNHSCYMHENEIVCWIKNADSKPVIYDCNPDKAGRFILPATKVPYQLYSSNKKNNDLNRYTKLYLHLRVAGKSFTITKKRKENKYAFCSSQQMDS